MRASTKLLDTSMSVTKFDTKEKSFADRLAKYENKWVAISRTETTEEIVGSGVRVIDAKRAAEKKGFKDAVYRKVPSSHKVLIA